MDEIVSDFIDVGSGLRHLKLGPQFPFKFSSSGITPCTKLKNMNRDFKMDIKLHEYWFSVFWGTIEYNWSIQVVQWNY